MPKLLVMAGGTGGHIYPAVAVAETLRSRNWDIAWMGNANGMESRVVTQYNYTPVWIRFGALRGKGIIRKLLLPVNLLRGFWQALCALRRERPDVVLGMGGYVTFPGGMMATLLGIPFIIHEQNAIAGLANRVLSTVADKVLSGFPGVLKKARWVGNPVRADIIQTLTPERRFAGRTGRLQLLVVGGSLGAQALNTVVPAALALIPEDERPDVVHQSGAKQLNALQTAYQEAKVDTNKQNELVAFIENMPERYARADLVICRAGALTIAELAAVGVASILVPYPQAVDDHQRVNAQFLSEQGAALLIDQKDFTAQRLAQALQGLNRESLLAMAKAARTLAKSSAAEDVALVCEQIQRQK